MRYKQVEVDASKKNRISVETDRAKSRDRTRAVAEVRRIRPTKRDHELETS